MLCRLTFDMSGGPKAAKQALERPLDEGVRFREDAPGGLLRPRFDLRNHIVDKPFDYDLVVLETVESGIVPACIGKQVPSVCVVHVDRYPAKVHRDIPTPLVGVINDDIDFR